MSTIHSKVLHCALSCVSLAALWLAPPALCAGGEPAPTAATPGAPSLVSLVDGVREAILSWDLAELKQAADRLGSAEPDGQREGFAKDYWLATARFHGVLIRTEVADGPSGSEVAEIVRPAAAALAGVLERHPHQADCHAMLATLYGLRIRARPLAALRLGPRLMKHRKAAEQVAKPSPRALYLEGVGRLSQAGNANATADALKILLRAERLFERESRTDLGRLAPDWGRPHNWQFIGEAYEKLGRPQQALAWYEKVGEAGLNPIRAREGIKRCQAQMERR
jgi:tetratricopeptide (TPR) repeat protein